MGQIEALRKQQRSPERENLAETIKRHKSTTDRLVRINAASEVLFVWGAQEKVEQAEQTLARARQRESRQLVAQLIGDQTNSTPSVERAEWMLEEAKDDLKRAQRTREAMDQELRAAEADVQTAQRSVREAVGSVIKSEGEAEKLLTKLNQARNDVTRIYETLSLLSEWNCLPYRWDIIPAYTPTNTDQPWREALAALEADADAPLPK